MHHIMIHVIRRPHRCGKTMDAVQATNNLQTCLGKSLDGAARANFTFASHLLVTHITRGKVEILLMLIRRGGRLGAWAVGGITLTQADETSSLVA